MHVGNRQRPSLSDSGGPFGGERIAGIDLQVLFNASIAGRKPNPSIAERIVVQLGTAAIGSIFLLGGPAGVEEGAALSEGMGMARRAQNIGEFSELEVPMQLRVVRRVARRAGIGLDGIRIKIQRNEALVDAPMWGYTHASGRQIDLYPNAFRSNESLVATLGHERTHVMQIEIFGAPRTSIEAQLNEAAAWGIEKSFVDCFCSRIIK